MKRFEINLAGNLILPARKRCLVYRAMLVYLLAAGGLLAVSCGKAISDVREALGYRHRARLIQQQFRSSHPGDSTMLQHADRLQKQIEACTQQANAIQTALPDDIRTVLPVLNFLVRQADRSALYKLTFIQKDDKHPALEFSIAVPARGRKSPGPVFLQNWQQNPELANCFSAITPATTIRGKSGDEDVFIMNYRASFKE
ncbi:MAG: hypothetical protein WC701_02475 [Kiritimatiellales bacterium]|jgi:hypothetical protein